MTSTTYSDNTPAVAITYNRVGQKLSAGNSASATVYGYDPATLRLISETVTGPVNRLLQRSYDTLGRASGIAVWSGTNTVEHQVGYSYDNAGRLASVTQGSAGNAKTFTYSYVPDSAGLIFTLTGPANTVTNTWETTRDVLASKENRAGATVVSRYDYIVNNLGQRTSVQQSGSGFTTGSNPSGVGFNLYGYDSLGQLTAAKRYLGDNLADTQNPVSGQQFGFGFDNIGNRLTATEGANGISYTPNKVNQYIAIQSGTSAPIAPAYDLDGNLTNDAAQNYQWDGENRLIKVTKVDGTQIICAYDAQSRRVRKMVKSGSAVTSDTAFIYDGWNMVAEYDLTNNATPTATNTWGLDLSGSPQGAGGVGGLLARNTNGTTYYYSYDGNGNISEMLDASGIAAHYEYGPFGEPLRVSGAMAAQNPFRFSTKYTDDETGLLYYGYRYYNPSTGRWINRDSSGERGGHNLYAAMKNSPIRYIDSDGRMPIAPTDFNRGPGAINNNDYQIPGMDNPTGWGGALRDLGDWVTGNHSNPTNYGPNSQESQLTQDSSVGRQLRKAFADKNKGKRCSSWQDMTNVRLDFGASEVLSETGNGRAQFNGSASGEVHIDSTATATGKVSAKFTVTNTTSLTSALYHAWPNSWNNTQNGTPCSNWTQTYEWTESFTCCP